MKVFLRTIKNKEHQVDVDETALVDQLLDACVDGFKPDFTKDAVILVYKGKVLQADKLVTSYGMNEGDRIVVMSQKKRDIGKKIKETPPAAKQEPIPEPKVSAPRVDPIKESSPATNSTPDNKHDDITEGLSNASLDDKIAQLVSMGFEESKARQMLEISNGEVDKATQLLLQGEMDEDLSAMDQAEPILEEALLNLRNAPNANRLAVGEEYTCPEDSPLHELVTSDAFYEMREMVRRDPSTLPRFIMEIFQANPELVEVVMQNEAEFLKCLFGAQLPDALQALLTGDYIPDGVDEDRAEQMDAMRAIEGQFTDEDKAAITRLMELGFGRGQVIEAYLACDKNENAAANFLFEEN